jgi:hypothetical protein
MVAILLEAREFCAFIYKDTAATFGVQFCPNSFNLGLLRTGTLGVELGCTSVSDWVMVSY